MSSPPARPSCPGQQESLSFGLTRKAAAKWPRPIAGGAAVALVIGTIEIGGLISSDLDLSGTFWDWFENADMNVLGFVIVAMFVTTSAIAALVWRLGGIEERWSAHLEDSRPREGSPWTPADRR